MRITKLEAIDRFGNIPELESFGDEYVYIEFMKGNTYKSRRQNNLFHSLLTCFYSSGCHSFKDYDDMRNHYKTIAGLIVFEKENGLEEFTKKCLFRAVKLLPISQSQRETIYKYLKGEKKIIKSWGEVSKKNAQITLDILMKDIEESKIFQTSYGKEYEKILKGLGQFYEEIK